MHTYTRSTKCNNEADDVYMATTCVDVAIVIATKYHSRESTGISVTVSIMYDVA